MFDFFIYISLYFIFHTVLSLVSLRIKNIHFDKFVQFLSTPLLIAYVIGTIIFPFSVMFYHIIFYFGLAFLVPYCVYFLLRYCNLIDFLTYETVVYFILSIGVFISTITNYYLKALVYNISPFTSKKSEKLKVFEFEKQTDYLLSAENVRFLTYGFYFMSLLVVNYYSFQNESLFESMTIDKAILQSFVTYIAFDRAYLIRKELSFKLLTMINNIKTLILKEFNSFGSQK